MCLRISSIAIALVFLGLALSVNTTSSWAARIDVVSLEEIPNSGPLDGLSKCNLRLRGEIRDGDMSRLERQFKKVTGRSMGLGLCLDSPGGSWSDALKIAQFVIEKRIWTVLEPDVDCFSACAIIFMSGVTLAIEGRARISRVMHVKSRLGFHAPYLPRESLPDTTYGAGTVEAAFYSAIRSIRQLMKLRRIPPRIYSSSAYGHTKAGELVSPDLIIEMLDKGPKESFLIDNVGKAAKYEIEVVGYRRADIITSKKLCYACMTLFYFGSNVGAWCRPPSVVNRERTRLEISFKEMGGCTFKTQNGRKWWASKGRERGGVAVRDWMLHPPDTPLKSLSP